jgi:hypothetical protein
VRSILTGKLWHILCTITCYGCSSLPLFDQADSRRVKAAFVITVLASEPSGGLVFFSRDTVLAEKPSLPESAKREFILSVERGLHRQPQNAKRIILAYDTWPDVCEARNALLDIDLPRLQALCANESIAE